jgi:hypothetical protein
MGKKMMGVGGMMGKELWTWIMSMKWGNTERFLKREESGPNSDSGWREHKSGWKRQDNQLEDGR